MRNENMTDYKRRKVSDWLKNIYAGRIAIPSFQRDYVWKLEQIQEFIKALLTDRPVGALLTMDFTNNPSSQGFKPRHFDVGDTGNNQEFTNCKELVLDGQQRLTSLWRALTAEMPHQKYFVEIVDWDDDELKIVNEEPVRRERDNAKVAKDPVTAAEQKLIPVSVLGIDSVTQERDALYKWCAGSYGNDQKSERQARQLCKKINESFVQKLLYRDLWFIQLPEDVSREEAIDIYIRTNKSSSIIKPFDIAVAQYDQQKETSLRNRILTWIEKTPAAKRLFNSDPEKALSIVGELILKIACLQKKKTPTYKNYWSAAVIGHLQKEKFGLDEILVGLEWTFELLGELKIFRQKYLPSVVPLRVVPALYPEFKKVKADHKGVVRRIIFVYIWRSFLGDRYDRAVNTRLKDDYDGLAVLLLKISECGLDRVDNNISGVPIFSKIGEFSDEKKLSLSSVKEPLKSPATKDTLAKSLLIISTLDGARDFASGEKINPRNIADRELHHIFPCGLLQKNKVKKTLIDHALNYCSIESTTNKKLLNKPPLMYLEDRIIGDKHLSENELKERIESHLIPFEAIKDVGPKNVRANYHHFIKTRAKLFDQKIQELVRVPQV